MNINDFIKNISFCEKQIDEFYSINNHDAVCSKIDELYRIINGAESEIDLSSLRKCSKLINKIRVDFKQKFDCEENVSKLRTRIENLRRDLEAIYASDLEKRESVGKSEFVKITHPLEKKLILITQTRQRLNLLRKFTEMRLSKANIDTKKLGESISLELSDIIAELFISSMDKACEKGLKQPSNDQWAVLKLGSLARNEATPYSDIDFLILVDPSLEKDEDTYLFFSFVMQEFADTVAQIGEESRDLNSARGI